MKIESLNNSKIKNIIKLKEKKYRDLTNTFLIEGDHLVKEALKLDLVLEVYSTENMKLDVPCYQVTETIMKKISNQVSISNVVAVCKKIAPKKIEGPVLILDGIQDPGNLGTIIRSCVAFSMPNLIISNTSVDLYNPKVIRSTEGMLFYVNILREDLDIAIPELLKNYQIIGTDVKSGVNIRDLKMNDNSAIIIGSEGLGMQDTKKYCDTFVKIPMNNACESLNAGVSASIILYECDNYE